MRDVVTPFRNKLWDLFRDLARGMDGGDVVVALKQAGEEIWAAGIDGTYSDMPQRDQEQEPPVPGPTKTFVDVGTRLLALWFF